MLRSIRGATTVDKNDKKEIENRAEELLNRILSANSLSITQITNIIFTCTKDLNQTYPAAAARNIGITHAALMCVQEMNVESSLPLCLRLMVSADMDVPQTAIKHIYLHGAKHLRPDLSEETAKAFAIAIDGPSGAGKSTVAKLCARELGFSYIDTGAMYRAFTFYCMEKGIDTNDYGAVDRTADASSVEVKFINDEQLVYVDGKDVTLKIRSQEVAENTSKVSVIPSVRKRLVDMQRELARSQSVVMDGRDIGTVVLKDSPLKIYLDATFEKRAKRRTSELLALGQPADFDEILEEVKARDLRDMTREESPLKKADDAVLVNCDNLSAEEVSAAICAICRIRMRLM